MYGKTENNHVEVKGFCDADFVADLDKRRSLIGYVLPLVEMWLKGITNELGVCGDLVKLYCESQSAIHLSKNTMFHERTKHIDVKLHFVRDIISKGIIKVEKISTLVNPVDMLIKAIPISKFEESLNLLKVLPT